ncbi:MAG: MATE family efflux transporter, partial [Treponema sp.]|nr:MATE family efflux transporter [Treponema sp.]
ANFLQTLYGMADLFIAGQFNGADVITAVSIGSQIMHMITVIIAGLAMGTTVLTARAVGACKKRDAGLCAGNSLLAFLIFSLFATAILFVFCPQIVALMHTPPEAVGETLSYLGICFLGIPFISLYNSVSAVFRGAGDSKRPLYFVAASCLVNIILDVFFMGPLALGSRGAALATVLSQAFSAFLAAFVLFARGKRGACGGATGGACDGTDGRSGACGETPGGACGGTDGRGGATGGACGSSGACSETHSGACGKRGACVRILRGDFRMDAKVLKALLQIGLPVSAQDGFIQVSFLVITIIANSRGLSVAAAVGIVEKIICFLFLVPSSMLSAISALAAQNMGASLHARARHTLYAGMAIASAFGALFALAFQFASVPFVSLFTHDAEVVQLGGQYLRSYVFDCFFAAFHFAFSGFFCAYGYSLLSFVHNTVSILLVRIPGAYLAAKYFPGTLYPMGWAPAIGSLLSSLICLGFYLLLKRNGKFGGGLERHGGK